MPYSSSPPRAPASRGGRRERTARRRPRPHEVRRRRREAGVPARFPAVAWGERSGAGPPRRREDDAQPRRSNGRPPLGAVREIKNAIGELEEAAARAVQRLCRVRVANDAKQRQRCVAFCWESGFSDSPVGPNPFSSKWKTSSCSNWTIPRLSLPQFSYAQEFELIINN